jgi:hypothetical protein
VKECFEISAGVGFNKVNCGTVGVKTLPTVDGSEDLSL